MSSTSLAATSVRICAVFLTFAVLASACSSGDDGAQTDPIDGSSTPNPTIQPDEDATRTTSNTQQDGPSSDEGSAMSVRIEPGQNDPDTTVIIDLGETTERGTDDVSGNRTASGVALADADRDALLDRLEDIETDPADTTEFARPTDTRRPPRPLTIVDAAFPPPPIDSAPVDPVRSPLEVLRYQPEGVVDTVPFISITFSNEMVPVGSIDQVESQEVPIRIDPPLDGRWVWLGTSTVRFEHTSSDLDRLPKATEYVVTIPAGTPDDFGGELAEAVEFTFTTPTARATSVSPLSDSLATDALFLVEFNQRVDPAQAIESIDLLADGDRVPIRLATADEIAQQTAIELAVSRLLPDRWLVMRSIDGLPTDSAIEITAAAVPSAEGPLIGDEPATFRGRTYAAFAFQEKQCAWGGNECPPGSPLLMRFNNPIAADDFDASLISIEPELPGAQIGVEFNSIVVRGQTTGRTDYTVTIAEGLTDSFGQTLDSEASATFTIGDAEPSFLFPGSNLVTLDPIIDDDVFTISTINHPELNLVVYQVDPQTDWPEFQENSWQLGTDRVNVDWPTLAENTLAPREAPNAWVETPIDLSDHVGATGHVVIVVTPNSPGLEEWQRQPLSLWVQKTDIGIDSYSTEFDRLVRVTSLSTGEPIAGATVTPIGERGRAGASIVTNDEGIATTTDRAVARTLVASVDGNHAILGDLWSRLSAPRLQTRWYVIDDRGLYKPGETANLKGLVRVTSALEPAAIELPSAASAIRWSARDAFGNEFATGAAELSDLGGFDLEIEIPDDITPGPAGIEFFVDNRSNDDGARHFHQLQIQEFRTPDFEVSVESISDGPYLAEETTRLLTQANYFATGPLGGAEVNWQVTASAGSYSPPGWSDYTFGIWRPWWFGGGQFGIDDFGRGPSFFGGNVLGSESLISTTDASGEHGVDLALSLDGKPRPVSLSAAATVIDVNRQAISGSTSLLVHPSTIYVGLRGERSFVESGDDLTIEIIATNIAGDLVPNHPVTVDLIRNTWRFENGSWGQVDEPIDTCQVTSDSQSTSCTFAPELGGSYRVVATTVDDAGRQNLTELTRWVAGEARPASRRVNLEEVTLIPQGADFEPGDVAEVLVQSPFADAHGLAIITRGGIASHQVFELDEAGSAVLEIPLTEADMPAVGVHVELVGTAPRDATSRPAFASAQLTFAVSTESRRLTVAASPASTGVTPGATTSLDVQVTDESGAAVADAELAVIVVDEAVLSLTNYELRDPLAAFYQRNGGWLQAQRGRSTLVLSDGGDRDSAGAGGDAADASEAMFEDEATDGAPAPQAALADDGGSSLARSAPQTTATAAGNEGFAKGAATPIELRSDFSALAVFEPQVSTNAAGQATIDLSLPDSLTRYRIMVVAAAGAEFAGTGESNLTARLPISVRPTAPRFANFGDRFEFPVVVQNATDEPREVDVALRVTNLELPAQDAVTVTVPANDRVEVRFETLVDAAGTARFQVVASSGDMTDAAEGSFPVYTPATSEAFATYGVVDNGSIGQNITAPVDVFPQFGGLEISTSSTAVSALTDAVVSLRDHRYQNADALSSRIIALLSLEPILTAFENPDMTAVDLDGTIDNDIERLVNLQNPDGGFSWWRRNRSSVPWVTVSATHALVLANQDGRDVPPAALSGALDLLSRIETLFPTWYDNETKTAIQAYALHVEHLAGRDPVNRATALFQANRDDLSPDVAAWLWPVLADDLEIDAEIERQLNNSVVESANAATFATTYDEQAWLLLHSDRRTDAIVLNSLLDQAPESDLVVKTLNGLLAARGRSGAWRNVQENSWILIAAGRYFGEFEIDDPAFVARAWLGETYALAHEHQGRRTEQDRTLVPMTEVLEGGDRQLVIDKDGSGRLYYRIGLRYAPTDLELEALDRGFVVQRAYEAIDDENDVRRNDDGSWQIAAGARVRIRLTMVAPARRTHVALIDPLPAGLEAINPTFSTSEPIPFDPGDEAAPFRSWFSWFNHQNLRDDRAEAFATWLGAGSYEYSYVARATIPGTFVVPPARAEQLYEPELFGRSASTVVTIIDQ